jgi:hypothetical protein
MFAVTINQMSSAVWAVYFVSFDGFFVTYAAFFEHDATVTIS